MTAGGSVPTPPPRPPQATPVLGSVRRLSPAGPAAGPRHIPPPSRARRAPTRGALLRRRIMVKLTKVVLPVLALGLLGAIAFWPELEGNGENSRVSFRRVAEPRPEALRVVAPHYRGVDDLARPYTITAAVAQQPGADEILDLTQPRADMTLTEGAWVYLRADWGRYDKAARTLALRGDVTIFHDNGTMLRTPSALVRVEEGSASGDEPVAVQGPFGTLNAEGFRLTERGALVIFTGKSHALLEGRP